MTKVSFFYELGLLVGFAIRGHSSVSYSDEQGKLICSAVSSAAYMTANTITEVIGAKADISVKEAEMVLKVKSNFEECLPVLSGFALHIEQLSKQYRNHIEIITEV